MQHKIGFYIRVSTDEQALRVDGSLENQKHRLLAEVKARNDAEKTWGKVIETYQDDGYSAKDTNRPAYQRMMRDVRAGKIDLILVAEFSRLSRNILNFCQLLEQLKRVGASIYSIKERFDTSTPAGHMMVMNMINLAQFEREQTAERVALNFHARALRGLWNGGQRLLGLESDTSNPGLLRINEKESEDVRAIFRLFLEEQSVARTAKRLNTLPIKPKALGKESCRHNEAGHWNSRSVLNLLRNKAYAGVREINAGNKEKNQDRLKPHQRYQTVQAAWPAVIDQDTFDEVQRILDENLKAERARLGAAEERVFLLSGILSCTECGRALVGCSGHGASNVYRYYVHRPIEGEKVSCSIKTLKADDLEQAILEHLDKRLTTEGYLDHLEAQVIERKKAESTGSRGELARRTEELAQLNEDIEATFKMTTARDALPAVVRLGNQRIAELDEKKAGLEARIAELEGQLADSEPALREMEQVREGLLDFKALKRSGSRRGIKRLIRKVFSAIRVERSRLGLCYWTASEAAIIAFETEQKRASGANPEALESNDRGQCLSLRRPGRPRFRDNAVEIMQFRKNGRGGGI